MSNDFWQTIGDFVAAEMRGAEQERERIIALLEEIAKEFKRKEELERYLAKVKKVLNERV